MSAYDLPRGFSLRELAGGDMPLLATLLPRLSEYHNRVAADFAGVYPILPVDLQIEKTAAQVESGNARVEILYEAGSASGFCKASFAAGHGAVDWLYVDERLRGRGLGAVLMRRMLEYLGGKGVSLVDLKVVLGNPAKHFYERFGFAARTEVMALRLPRPGREGESGGRRAPDGTEGRDGA